MSAGVSGDVEAFSRAWREYCKHLGPAGQQEYRDRWKQLRALVEGLLIAPVWTLDSFLALVSGNSAEAIIVNLEGAFLGDIGFPPLPNSGPEPPPNSIEYVLIRIGFQYFDKDVAWKPSNRLALRLIAEAALHAGASTHFEDFVAQLSLHVSSWGLHELLPAVLAVHESPMQDSDAAATILNRARRAHGAATCHLVALAESDHHISEFAQAVSDLEQFCWREHYLKQRMYVLPEEVFGGRGAPSQQDLDRAVPVSLALARDDQQLLADFAADAADGACGSQFALLCADFVDGYPILNECLKASRSLIPWALLADPRPFKQHVLPLVTRDHAYKLLNTKYADDHRNSFYHFAHELLALMVNDSADAAQIEALLHRMGARDELDWEESHPGKLNRNGRFLMVAAIALALQKHLAAGQTEACREWLAKHGELSQPMLGWAVSTAYLPAYLEIARVQARIAELDQTISDASRDNLLAWGDLLSYVVELAPAKGPGRSKLQELFLPHLRQFGATLASTGHAADGFCLMQRARSWELVSILDPEGCALVGDESDTLEQRATRDLLFRRTGMLQGDEWTKPISARPATDESIQKLSDFPDVARTYAARYTDAGLLANVIRARGLDKLRIIAFDVVPHASSSDRGRAAAEQNGDFWASAWQAGTCTAVNLGSWFADQRCALDELHELLFDGRALNQDVTNDEVNKAGQRTADILGELAATLLKPIWEAAEGDGWAPPESVLVIPTGRLFWIPWMAMPVGTGDQELIKLCPVSVVPSLGLAVWLMTQSPLDCSNTFAFVGPEYFDSDDERDKFKCVLNPTRWTPQAHPEDLLGGKLDAKCLAIACHGNHEENMYLQLFEGTEGRLSLQKLIDRRPHLRAELALLGCCWTGQESTGLLDEVSGFAAALMQCGVRHVIAGLGQIPRAVVKHPCVLQLLIKGTGADFRDGIRHLRHLYIKKLGRKHPACWSLIQWYGLPSQGTRAAICTPE
ncbi:MAG: CHAT domain-containing protein [Phycisphaerales bacterium]|nr:CHAT domain-containing protein [Phycisphaerales bacterium]